MTKKITQKITNLKLEKFKSKFILLLFNEDQNPSLPFYAIEYKQNLYDLASL
ncbi:hypothetical protein [Mycoplasmopsis gallinarum]|uniref:Uncharacterized protein n=1 Tax=Mycoplasmopsis gallinarum TaxID=29557 RepID=A0A168RBX0_9BACT|nr:hypothetical protein [Mycoplasmopsis gallinarum]OAB48819.1 hypothetical protein MGALLINA_03880 [Mycoplasmopsis gallinarum]